MNKFLNVLVLKFQGLMMGGMDLAQKASLTLETFFPIYVLSNTQEVSCLDL